MHQTSTGRKAIYIPHSVDVMTLDELANRLAAVICSLKESTDDVTSDIEADAAWYEHAKAAERFRSGLIAACEVGKLTARDQMAHMQCSPEEKGAVVLVDEAANYLATSGASVRITRHPETLAFIGLHPDELVPLDDVPWLVATAMHDLEADGELHGFQRLVTEKRIYEAAGHGLLAMFDPVTRQRLSFRTTGACVTAGGLCTFFSSHAQSANEPEPLELPAPVSWNGQTYQPGPHLTDEEVEAARVEVEAIQDAERRGQVEIQDWTVKKPQRFSPYGAPLYKLLHAEWLNGCLRRPTARDVLDAWSASNPPEILEVMQDGLKYYGSKGNVKTLSLAALKEAIARMTPRND